MSSVCQENAQVVLTDEEKEAIVARLTEDRERSFNAGKEGAFQFGVDWAKSTATLRELRQFSEGEESDCIDNDGLLDLLDMTGEVQDRVREGEYDRHSYVQGFLEGVIEGVTAVWNELPASAKR